MDVKKRLFQMTQEQKSSFESEDGYIDLIIESAGNKRIIVILELKQTEDESRDKVLIARSATDHIISRKYADPYLERNDIAGIYAYGICFCKNSSGSFVKSITLLTSIKNTKNSAFRSWNE